MGRPSSEQRDYSFRLRAIRASDHFIRDLRRTGQQPPAPIKPEIDARDQRGRVRAPETTSGCSSSASW
jgi:hypothetical protein